MVIEHLDTDVEREVRRAQRVGAGGGATVGGCMRTIMLEIWGGYIYIGDK